MSGVIETEEVPLWKSPFFVANKIAKFVAENGIPELPSGLKSMIELVVERRERSEEMGVRLSPSWITKTVYF